MSVIVNDTGVLKAMLDEAQDFLIASSAPPQNQQARIYRQQKAAQLINSIVDKSAAIIEEGAEKANNLNFSVTLPNRYYKILEQLDTLGNSKYQK